MKDLKEYRDLISDNEIRIIGEGAIVPTKKANAKRAYLGNIIISIVIIVAIAFIAAYFISRNMALYAPEPEFFESRIDCIEHIGYSKDRITIEELQALRTPFGRVVDDDVGGFCEIKDTVINDIPLKIYIPHNADMKLHIGRIPQEDESVIYVAQAADVRADNGGIVGAFVLNGKPLAWGLSKKGYCAAINGDISIGVAENTHLFEKATEEGGYFFRQYPLVDNGRLVENEPKGKSIRRAICDRMGEIFMIETLTPESFHDFSQALVDLGIRNAVYLVGSAAHGWAVDEDGERHEWGKINIYRGRRGMPKNTSYIIWRKR